MQIFSYVLPMCVWRTKRGGESSVGKKVMTASVFYVMICGNVFDNVLSLLPDTTWCKLKRGV